MASINKLSIRGVRAFSPEDTEQVLEFFTPLTIIVGANGCGKTTIIESLKYAITGALPPGNRSGHAFVHDPRSIGQAVVKASVKLRFTTKAGTTMVVVRSMELQQKKTAATFRQLDGVLRTMDPRTGDRQSLSHKCTELDRQIPLLMGVSNAILEHVLFCHQEEASWPLQEGAVLKKRFDAIFDSTRYSKAIEVLRKKEKSYISMAKDIKAELASLNSHKHAATGFQCELDQAHEVMEEIDETKISIAAELKQTEETIATYAAVVDQLDAVDDQIKLAQDELYRQTTVVDKQREMVEVDMTSTHTIAQLQAQWTDFDETMSTQLVQYQKLQQQQQQLHGELSRLRQNQMKLSNDLTKHHMAKEGQQERLRKRYALMEEMAQTHALDLDLAVSQNNTQSSFSVLDQSFAASLTAATMASHQHQHGAGGAGAGALSQESIISITAQDMEGFFAALDKKESDLQGKLDSHKKRTKEADDEMQKVIQDLNGKLQIVKNDLERLGKRKAGLQEEQAQLSRMVSSHSRLRKSDVEESRNKATALAKQRDEANNDPRKKDIPAEIRQLEDKIDKIKRQMDDDRITLNTLRVSADAQSSITILEEQCAKDLEGLQEAVRDHTSTLQKFNIPNVDVTLEGDEHGDDLLKSFENLMGAVRSKYEEAHLDLSRATEDVARTQQIVSEKTALMSSSQQTIMTLKPKLERVSASVDNVRKVAQDLRRHETSIGLSFRENEESPREFLQYLEKRLVDIQDDAPIENEAKAIKKLMKRLLKASKEEDGGDLTCPCCKRAVVTEKEATDFFQAMELLAGNESPLLKTDHRYLEFKTKYEEWKKVLTNSMDDLRDHQRMSREMKDAEIEHQRLMEDISHFQLKLRNEKTEMGDLQNSDEELRQVLDLTKRWLEEAGRIAEKRMQIGQKHLDLTASLITSDRDLKTVERDLHRMAEEKDDLSNKINNLNRETTQLNTAITNLSAQATRMDQVAREKEERFASEQKNFARKAEVVDELQTIGQEEIQLQDQLAPLSKKISLKTSERDRARALGDDEEKVLSKDLSKFQNDVRGLRALAQEIDQFEASNKTNELETVEAEVASVQDSIAKRQRELKALQPQLEEMKKTVDDQERHKKQLLQNIDILESEKRIAEVNKEIERLKEERGQIEGADEAYELADKAEKRKAELQERKYRTEGRFHEIAEQIRSLKRKLKSPEYSNVEEEYRIAMIKHETTLMAASDLKKYAGAIDKALLQFHGIKIAEINKIIRELWLMCYKGEDITNIELVSGQEPGSKASKSYNYRVVMTKGTARMDMRGRCSAGQRVLACIVIRLALAEAFGVAFGALSLDEPTINLDWKNKKGLAIALANIVAARSHQRNFQLVMITHDEEFVGMMKTELSSLTGFSMPEKYFQVRREQGVDGMYYSKIDAVDWDELV